MSNWIKCSERMPEENGEQFLLQLSGGSMACGKIEFPFDNPDMCIWLCPGGINFYGEDVTHWQPLPEPPKD